MVFTLLVALGAALQAMSAAAAGNSNNFLIMGDWGGQPTAPFTTPGEVATAAMMAKWAEEHETAFVLAMGDNMYDRGVTNVSSTRFQTTFENVFSQSVFESMPFYVIAGNHDWYGNVTAQVDYTSHSKRWTFPNLWYTFSHTFDNGVKADFLAIDTVTLAGLPLDEDDPVSGVTGERLEGASTEWDFIEDALRNSTAPYLFVFGHYPIYSPCSHGPTGVLVEQLYPMLNKYKASAYLAGHDHCASSLRVPGNYTAIINSGNAHECCYQATNVDKCPPNSILFLHADESKTGGPSRPMDRNPEDVVPDAGFASITVTPQATQVQYVAASGEVQYTGKPILPRD